jgi:hypothetical protein
MEQGTKPPWLSKMLWWNVISVIAYFIPSVKEAVTPEIYASLVGVVNILLRIITKDKIEIS